MTDKTSFQRLEALFHELEALSVEARRARLQALAQDEPALHAELVAMFDSPTGLVQREAGLEGLADVVRGFAGPTQAPADPLEIGPYRLGELLGEGGMGRVYRAEQQEPVQRTVALKVTRRGMDSDEALARFRAERQALAVLDHPNIARVFDAGSSSDGRPWFAMELIEGLPITRWAGDRGLDLRQRIALLLPVCDAIQHAHRKGLIHRDLKPSNILVVDDGGIGLPKVIDFGIAKLTDFSRDGRSFATAFGELLGTPEYMSPEQASMGEIDVDTRSDVYALGLVLYELLVGELPLSQRALREMGFEAMCRAIREGDTPRPSAYAGRRGDGITLNWKQRLRGDLDSVLLKSLAKDREQRYGSASALAEDLRRYLDDQPVLAQPPSLRYRTFKFVRRHKLAVGAGAAVVTALLVGTMVAGLGLLEARRAEARAIDSQQQALEAKGIAESASGFLIELFSGADPRDNPGLDLTARELLERGEARIENLADAPAVQARLLEALGDVYWSLGAFDRAESLLLRGIELRRQPQLADPERLSALLDRLGGLERDRKALERAEELYREALAVLSDAGIEGGEHVGRSLNNLGIVLRQRGQLDEAAAVLAQALAVSEALPALDEKASTAARARVANLRANLGSVHQARGDFLAAREATRGALLLAQDELPREHPFMGALYNNLARASDRLGELAQALEEAEQALAIDRAVLPADHPSLADTLMLVGQVQTRLGRFEASAAHFDEGYALAAARLGEANPRTRWLAFERARLDLLRGDSAAARTGFERLARTSASSADTPRLAAGVQRYLALSCRAAGARDCAAEAVREAGVLAGESARGELALTELLGAILALEEGRVAEAERRYREALRLGDCAAAGPCDMLDDAGKLVMRAHWWALQGDQDVAFEHLAFAVDAPTWRAWMLDSADFAALRDDPRWPLLQARLAARAP